MEMDAPDKKEGNPDSDAAEPRRESGRHRLFTVVPERDYVAYMENVVESLRLPVFAIDHAGVVTVWNRAMERIFSPKDKALGCPLKDALPQMAEEQEGIVWTDVLVSNVIAEGRDVEARRFELTTTDGPRPFNILASPIRSPGGQLLGSVVSLREVAREVAMEEDLLLTARTTSLASLAASLAHEIRNPLNAISMNMQLLREAIAGKQEDSEATRGTVDLVLAEVSRLDKLLKDFLGFAKPSPTRLSIGSLNETVRETLDLLREPARKKSIDLVVEFGDLPDVLHDTDQIRQVVFNLLLNSFEAVSEGGRVELVTERRGDWVRIRITDNGPGMDEKDAERMFELFYTTKEKGSGLGLAIARRLVEAHHGRISYEPAEGGAFFSVYLPLKIVSR
ncbi:MAG: PAS domain-containing protein [Planctomycetota bacterium]|nr:MAG: PAS domain-containing protein [Planctomycetota bacterium]